MTIADSVVFRVWLAVWLACVVMAIGLAVTRRVIAAWLTYFELRRRPLFQKQSERRWLWIKTLRRANGKDVKRPPAGQRRVYPWPPR